MRWIDNTKKKIGLNTLFEKASFGNLSNTKGKRITTNIDNTVVKIVLSTAMTIQIIDAIIGFKRKEIPMIIGPSIAATIHGLTAWYI